MAFSVTLKDYTTFQASETIVFDDVISNLGNAYNNETGVFTAPYDGLYEFIMTATVQSNGLAYAFMYVNGTQIGRARADSGNQMTGKKFLSSL